MDASVAAVTVRLALAEVTLLRRALMCTEPTPVPIARPLEPAALLTVAIDGSDEVQVTCEVRFWVEWSENTPVAVNCAEVPLATLGVGGVTSIDINKAAVTARLVWLATPAALAEMVVAPLLSAVTTPFDPLELLMVAAEGLDDAQAALAVMSEWVLSLITAVAVSCVLIPAATCGLVGVISIDLMVGAEMPPLPPPPEHAARNPRRAQIRARATQGARCEVG